jgi:hypothetical protein
MELNRARRRERWSIHDWGTPGIVLRGEPVDLGSGRIALGAELDPELAPVLGVDPAVVPILAHGTA